MAAKFMETTRKVRRRRAHERHDGCPRLQMNIVLDYFLKVQILMVDEKRKSTKEIDNRQNSTKK